MRRLARRGVRSLYRSTELVLMSWDLAEGGAPDGTGTLTVRPIEEDDFPALEEFCRVHRSDDPEALARLTDCRASGYPGFLATSGGALLGHFWWVARRHHRAHPHPRIRLLGLRIGAETAYLFDYYIAPPHRGRGHSRPFLAGIRARLRSLGFGTAVLDVLADNERALRAYRSAGLRETRRVRIRALVSTVLVGPGGWLRRDPRWF